VSRIQRSSADIVAALETVARAVGEGGGAAAIFTALDRAIATAIGHRLFTVMRYHAESTESERVYSSNPAAYPVGGRKALPAGLWVERVVHERQPFLGRNAGDIRDVFPDHELIASLGLQSVLNIPVLRRGTVLGTLNLLHQENWYDEADFALGAVFAALAVTAFELLPDP